MLILIDLSKPISVVKITDFRKNRFFLLLSFENLYNFPIFNHCKILLKKTTFVRPDENKRLSKLTYQMLMSSLKLHTDLRLNYST